MRVILKRQMYRGQQGGGMLQPGTEVDLPVGRALEMIQRGAAEQVPNPVATYQTRAVQPVTLPEVRPVPPASFRGDVPVPDQEPPRVVAACDPVLSEPDVSKPKAADSQQRRKRGRSGARRRSDD